MKLKTILLLFLLILPLSLSANFDFNANCLKAYQQIFELKLGAARQLLAAEKKIRPNNSIVPLLENYIDYFHLLSTDQRQDFDRLEANKSRRLAQISKDDANSPYYLYAQAEINLQWAIMRGRYGSYYTAAREINKAYAMLTENNKKFPGFHLNAKGLGLINAMMGVLPDGFFKSALAAFGIKGDIQTGINMLDKLAENLPKSAYESFYEETVFYYLYVLTDVAQQDDAFAKTMKFTQRFADSSLLKTYLQAYVAIRTRHNNEAITALNNRPIGVAYQPFPYLDYLMGLAQLNKLDDSAAFYFNRFLQNNKGSSYVQDTYLHLAWIALLKGNDTAYQQAILKVKNSGTAYHERDKQAINEANTTKPDIRLLKARLYFDGGYLTNAMTALNKTEVDDYTGSKDKTEYHYRLARILDEQGNEDQAITNYQAAMNSGKALKHYFAAKSAIFIANIYEKRNQQAKARSFYQAAINFKNHEYESGIENEARLGLKRNGS